MRLRKANTSVAVSLVIQETARGVLVTIQTRSNEAVSGSFIFE